MTSTAAIEDIDGVREAEAGDAAILGIPALEAADVDLGLRYLTDYRVVVLADPSTADVVAVAADAARWGEARLIVVVAAGRPAPDGLPGDAVVLEAPDADPDGAFADLVGAFAAALDAGDEPETAFRGVARVGRLERRRVGLSSAGRTPASAGVRRSTQSPTVGWAGSASRSISSGPSRRTSLTSRTTG